jgi:Sulfotransferase family
VSAGAPVVAYVAGYGRSGSTFLARLLGQSNGAVAAGELVRWREWIGSSRPCACGQPIASCPLWSAVRRALPANAAGAWRTAIESPLVFLFGFWWIPAAARRHYRDAERALFGAVAVASGARVVVDSSKTARRAAGRALALRRIAGLDVCVLHLVRNPQSVRASIERGTNKALEGRTEARRAFARSRAFLGWAAANGFARSLARRQPPGRAFRLDFEKLGADPLPSLEPAADALGLDLGPVGSVLDGRASPVPEHVAEGNRMRLEPLARVAPAPAPASFADRLLGTLLCGFTCWRLGISPLGPGRGRHA